MLVYVVVGSEFKKPFVFRELHKACDWLIANGFDMTVAPFHWGTATIVPVEVIE